MTTHHPVGISIAEIRPETSRDHAEITVLVAAAFKSTDESDLVDAIRRSAAYLPELALVAVHRDRIIGYVMVSRVSLHDGSAGCEIACLAPLAVDPRFQGRGVGSTLVCAAIEKADATGETMIVLEGSPRYYGRFGFVHAPRLKVEMDLPSWAPPGAAQVLPLERYDTSMCGKVILPSPFGVGVASNPRGRGT